MYCILEKCLSEGWPNNAQPIDQCQAQSNQIKHRLFWSVRHFFKPASYVSSNIRIKFWCRIFAHLCSGNRILACNLAMLGSPHRIRWKSTLDRRNSSKKLIYKKKLLRCAVILSWEAQRWCCNWFSCSHGRFLYNKVCTTEARGKNIGEISLSAYNLYLFMLQVSTEPILNKKWNNVTFFSVFVKEEAPRSWCLVGHLFKDSGGWSW